MMVAVLVGPASKVARVLEARVDIRRNVELDGTDEARARPRPALRLVQRHELEEVRSHEVLQLHEVGLVVGPETSPTSRTDSPVVARNRRTWTA